MRFPTGLPETIAPITEAGASARFCILYRTYNGSNVWHPTYTMHTDGGDINIDLWADIREDRVPEGKADALDFVRMVTKYVGRLDSSMNAENLLAYEDQQFHLKLSDGKIIKHHFLDENGVGYVYGTGANATKLIDKNDCAAMLVRNTQGEAFVIQTIAIRPPLSVYDQAKSADRLPATLVFGWRQTATVNIYTKAQYVAAASLGMAKKIDDWKGESGAFEPRTQSTDNGLAAGFDAKDEMWKEMDAPAFAAGGNFGAEGLDDAFASSTDQESGITQADDSITGFKDSESSSDWKSLAQKLVKPILEYRIGGQHVWFWMQMRSLTEGQRDEVYEALYLATQNWEHSSTENPLKPSFLRQGDDGLESFDAVSSTSDGEIYRKIKRAMELLGVEQQAKSASKAEIVYDGGF